MNARLRSRYRWILLGLLLSVWLFSSTPRVQSDLPYLVFLPVVFSPKIPLPNSSFENGTENWFISPVSEKVIFSLSELPIGVVPRTGQYAAWLGYHRDPDPVAETSFSQRVTVPSIVPNLSFWILVKSSQPYDTARSELSVWIDGELNWTMILCKERNTYDWDRQIIDLKRYSNQEIDLRIQVTLAGGEQAQVFLDDFEFTPN